MEIGFFPPFVTQAVEAKATALPVKGSPISSPVLADRLKDDELALKAFGPSPAQATHLRELPESEKATVVTHVLGHREVKFPTPRSMTGRPPFWDHL